MKTAWDAMWCAVWLEITLWRCRSLSRHLKRLDNALYDWQGDRERASWRLRELSKRLAAQTEGTKP